MEILGETGYHRQKLAELKREIVSDLKKNEEGHATPYAYSRVARECDVPDGWVQYYTYKNKLFLF